MKIDSNPPLIGLRVLDLSRVLAGPFCSMALGDMGADVIKVERPGSGDDTRRFGPPFIEGVSTYYLSINRNKRSLALDLKHPEGKAILWRLIEDADVLLENFRPGALARLGFDYDTCAARNPRLVYCSISAFGHAGIPEWSRQPGYDVIIQGMGGIPSLTGPPEGAPFKVGASIADVVSGMNAVQGILLALLARQRTGVGQAVDCSMLDGQLGLLTYLASAWLNTGNPPPRLGNGHLSVAPYGTFRTEDGWLNVAVANDALWRTFCALLERHDLYDDPRFVSNPSRVSNTHILNGLLGAVFVTHPTAYWLKILNTAGIPAGPILSIDQVLQHPQVAARNMVIEMTHSTAGPIRTTGIPIRLEGTPGRIRRPPPTVGQHSDEILSELGLEDTQIRRLRDDGVVG